MLLIKIWVNSIIYILLFAYCIDNSYALSYFEFKVSSIHKLIQNRNATCKDIIKYFLERAYKYNPKLNAIINFNSKAISEAIELDKAYCLNEQFVGRLHCVPVIVKDNIDVKNLPTTGGIKALRYSIPNKDANVIARLRAEGAIVIAKSNLAEMAFGEYISETGGECKNPWDTSRTCSRSSSGSGAAIAAGMAIIGLGTETSGSIQGPAGYNGIFALKPLLGESDMDGIIPLIDVSDTVGPFSSYLEDLVLTYSIMIGNYSIYEIFDQKSSNNNSRKNYKIGYFKRLLDPFNFTIRNQTYEYKPDIEVHDEMIKAIDNLRMLNVDVIELDINDFEDFILTFDNLLYSRYENCRMPCYKMSLDRYFNDLERFQSDSPYSSFDDFKKSDLLSDSFKNYLNEADASNAFMCNESCKKYTEQRIEFEKMVKSWYRISDSEQFDAILYPTMISLPEKLTHFDIGVLLSPLTISSVSGCYTLNIPIGFSKPDKDAPDGLPIGALLMSSDEKFMNMIHIAKMYDNAYLKQKKLPRNTPIIKSSNSNIKCFFLNSGTSTFNRIVFIYFILLFIIMLMFS